MDSDQNIQALERYDHAKATATRMRAIEGAGELGQQKLEAMAAAMEVSPEALAAFIKETAKAPK